MATPKRVFISRELAIDSVFRALLEGKVQVEAQSLVAFKACPIEQLPVCNWLFFYSKKGLAFGWPTLKNLTPTTKVAVLGAASGEYLQAKLGYTPDFVGTGAPESTAAAFLDIAQGKKVCFVQAKNSRQSVALLLGNQVQAQTFVAYDNQPKQNIDLPACDILVFTSPLNAQAYYQQYPAQQQQAVIAIGQTTASALKTLGTPPTLIASAPNERALANCCLSLL